jgi:two-component system sensor histidine kinase/response regulator
LPWVGYDSKAKLCLPSGMRCSPLKRQCLIEEPPSFIAICTRAALRMLEKRGHKTTLAENGREVLALLESQTFDLILMDVQMPVMNGVDATIEIRQQEQKSGHHVPIYAMTANAMKGDRERYLSIGMDGYLTKPIRPEELDQLLSEIAARSLTDHMK